MATPPIVAAVGTVAALLSIASFAPQIIKILKTRDARTVSLRTYIATVAAFGCWITYGVMVQAWPVIASNVACLLMAGAVLVLKWRFSRRPGR
jgi:MtN3 and saliva related transmembrane protein